MWFGKFINEIPFDGLSTAHGSSNLEESLLLSAGENNVNLITTDTCNLMEQVEIPQLPVRSQNP